MTPALLGTLVAATLTLVVLSSLWRDSLALRFVEQLFVGVALGFVLVWQVGDVLGPKLVQPLLGGSTSPFGWLVALLGLVLCVLSLARFVRDWAPLSRVPLSVIAGAFIGLAAVGAVGGELIPQLIAQTRPYSLTLDGPCAGATCSGLDRVVFVVGVVVFVAVLGSFAYVLRPQSGGGARVFAFGRYVLMAVLGATVGYALVGRSTVILERVSFLGEAGFATLAAAVVVLALVLATSSPKSAR